LTPGESRALAAHIDFFPTLAEIAGAKLSADVKRQIEGRSLVPLLQNPGAKWADRHLFKHVGRWPKSADPNESKFTMGAVRNTRWAECLPLMVNEKALGPKLNPFAVWCWDQFGGGPTAADYERMDPTQPWPAPAAGKKAGKRPVKQTTK
jgi:arylsulfatase A-like enzyme